MKKIGVASAFMYPDKDRTVFGQKSLCYIEKDMARYLSHVEAFPILIPDLGKAELDNFMGQMDGFVFQGGTDIAPESYGQAPIENDAWPGDPIRDQFELSIMEYAVKNGKPILGICRGFQLMNIYFGGTLYQDIETQRPNSIVHRDAELYDQLNHQIQFTPDSFLSKLYDEEGEGRVNSVHHQGVDKLGDDLDVFATCAEDELIEAFGSTQFAPGRVMGVQWHPEFFYNSETPLIYGNTLYSQFLDNC
ncbi:MAG TPA: gamma-glutamyl-gamma-aminobutyrate hydrolase family protein [Flavobacteriales bacterium]|nr:gamma-glutamyl-gamma-aminobutyrate hydrolase family protein [Flavobacteriales bacterium]